MRGRFIFVLVEGELVVHYLEKLCPAEVCAWSRDVPNTDSCEKLQTQ